MAYDNTNRGTLGRNDRKEKDTHPDYAGEINIEGVDYWLSGWVKEAGPNSKTPGRKFFSLAVKPKQAKSQPNRQEPSADIPDDDVPF